MNKNHFVFDINTDIKKKPDFIALILLKVINNHFKKKKKLILQNKKVLYLNLIKLYFRKENMQLDNVETEKRFYFLKNVIYKE